MFGISRSKINDAFLRGTMGGLIAGILKDIPDLLFRMLWNIKKVTFWGYMSEITLNLKPHTFVEHLIAFLIEVIFSLGLGVIYSVHIVKWFPTKHYLLRGTFYGTSCWFILISGLKFFRIPDVLTKDIATPALTLVFSAIYGLMLGYMDEKWSSGGSHGGSKGKTKV